MSLLKEEMIEHLTVNGETIGCKLALQKKDLKTTYYFF